MNGEVSVYALALERVANFSRRFAIGTSLDIRDRRRRDPGERGNLRLLEPGEVPPSGKKPPLRQCRWAASSSMPSPPKSRDVALRCAWKSGADCADSLQALSSAKTAIIIWRASSAKAIQRRHASRPRVFAVIRTTEQRSAIERVAMENELSASEPEHGQR
jgi:hypothetical protein